MRAFKARDKKIKSLFASAPQFNFIHNASFLNMKKFGKQTIDRRNKVTYIDIVPDTPFWQEIAVREDIL